MLSTLQNWGAIDGTQTATDILGINLKGPAHVKFTDQWARIKCYTLLERLSED